MEDERPGGLPVAPGTRGHVAALVEAGAGMVREALAQAPGTGQAVVDEIRIAMLRSIAQALDLTLSHGEARGLLPRLLDGHAGDPTGTFASLRDLGTPVDAYLAAALTERLGWRAFLHLTAPGTTMN